MSKLYLIIFIIFLSQSFSDIFDILNSEIVLKAINASIYLDDKYHIFNENYSECFLPLINYTSNYTQFKIIHPQFFNANGKGIDDLGKELECLSTNLYTEYLFVHIHTNKSIIKTDNGVTDYLNRTYASMGFCIPKECVNISYNILETMNKSNISIFNEHNLTNINIYSKKDTKESSLFTFLFSFLIILLCIKIIFGIIAKFLYRNGYEYHGVKLYKEINQDEIINEEKKESEKMNLIGQDFSNNTNKRDNSNELNLKGDYNPNYDFESYYPWGIRLIKYLDLFNNIITFIGKRNRYFNERDLTVLYSIKSIVLGYIILSEIITILIELPNTSAFNYDFYKSVTMMLYKRSTNGLTFWVVLESATFSFKLMKFVKKKLGIHGRKIISKRGQTIFLFKQLLKFLIFYIPKIIIFFVIYFIFYFLFDFYTSNFQVSMTFHYIFKNFIFSKHCYTEILYIFFPFMNYKYELPYDYNSISFPFIYVL